LIRPPSVERPKSVGRIWRLLGILFLVWIGFSLIRIFWSGAEQLPSLGRSASRADYPRLEEVVVEEHDSENKIAIIEVEGLITGVLVDGYGRSMVSLIEEQLKAAGKDRAVKAVLVKVDSPGGEILAADAIYRAFRDFQTEFGKPLVASMGGVAASGGYYVSAPCQWIVAHELTITGSIGVIMHTYNYRALMDKVGIRPVVYKSGRFKDMLSGDKSEAEISPQEGEMIQALIQQSFDQFKRIIAEGRALAREKNDNKGKTLASDWEIFADGRVLSGKEAFQKGFVDELGDFKQAVKSTLALAGIRKANLIRYQATVDLSTLLRWFVKSEGSTVRINWGLELPPLRRGCLYYVAPSLIP